MFLIDNILIDADIPGTFFMCDLEQCKGACCTFEGEFGAPVLDEEIDVLTTNAEIAKQYLSKRSLDIIQKKGIVDGYPGAYTTVCINKRDCVFVYYEGDVAKCALEKAYFDGKSTFRKPLSCHLFPIRVKNYGGTYLHYEKIDECRTALQNGARNRVLMHQSLKSALVRAFGEEWYDFLDNYVKTGSLLNK